MWRRRGEQNRGKEEEERYGNRGKSGNQSVFWEAVLGTLDVREIKLTVNTMSCNNRRTSPLRDLQEGF